MQQLANVPPSQIKANPFIEGETDVTGYLAFIHYLLSIKNPRVHAAFSLELLESSEEDVTIFRAFAKQCLDDHISRVVRDKLEIERSSSFQVAFRDIVKSSYDVLLSKQESGFQKIVSSVERSSGTNRQIIISVIASFVFGVIVSLARFIDPPFNVPLFQRGSVPTETVPSR